MTSFFQLPGTVWFEHALENALGSAAAAAMAVWTGMRIQDIASVPWQALAGAAALGALASILKSFASLHVGPSGTRYNGTASLNPHVVSDQ